MGRLVEQAAKEGLGELYWGTADLLEFLVLRNVETAILATVTAVVGGFLVDWLRKRQDFVPRAAEGRYAVADAQESGPDKPEHPVRSGTGRVTTTLPKRN